LDPLIIDAKFIYQELQDAVIDCPKADYDKVVSWLCSEYGIQKDEFDRRFRRAHIVYENAKEDVRERTEARKRFEALRREASNPNS